MSKAKGMLTPEELRNLIRSNEIDTVLTVFPDLYGRLMGKRITGSYFVDRVLDGSVHACDYLLACDMEMEPVPGYDFTSWEKGYGDFRMVPDPATMRRATWLEKTALVICDLFDETREILVDVAPRSILKKQIDRARKLGYLVKGASELEFYIFKDSFEQAQQKGYDNLEPIGSYIEDYHILQGTKEEFIVREIRNQLENSGVPVEFSKGEWGPGQQEINLRYTDLLEMADRHTIYKHAAKEIAWQKDCSLTFMAKWDERFAGSSMHIHMSLWSPDGNKALFPGKAKTAGVESSPLFRHFLGGWMAHVKETFAFFAPYPTSYKRYLAGSFAPTAIACSYDNRTAGFRILGHGNALRIECRAPGADANPYLAFAAALAAGLDGVENKTEPPPFVEGDLYNRKDLERVPGTLIEAITEMENSGWIRKAFGEEVVEHYLHFFRIEQRKFDQVVTNWERARYFERG